MEIKSKSKLRDLVRKLIFFAVFYGVVFGQFEIIASYDITRGIEKALTERRASSSFNFYEIYNRTHINTWIYGNLPTDILDLGNLLDDEAADTERYFYMANHNVLITDIRTSI